MNYIDIVLIILLVVAAISGFKNGLIAEVISLAALVLGIWGAIEFSSVTAEFLTENLNLQTNHLGIISFIVTFVVIIILVHIVGNVVNKMVESMMMGFVNKLAGLIFGVLKAVLVLSIMLLVFDFIDEDVKIIPKKTKAESRMYAPIRDFAPSLLPFIDFWNNKKAGENSDGKVA
ncbi:MAG: CvpA family protein [Prolixibacteraceae bacterium]|nr:CvpA family protein [Prolixibacteraceae bacterium]